MTTYPGELKLERLVEQTRAELIDVAARFITALGELPLPVTTIHVGRCIFNVLVDTEQPARLDRAELGVFTTHGTVWVAP